MTRWSPTSPEYEKTVRYINNRKYEQALDHLHRLVIQRLFELHKLNLSKTGEWMLNFGCTLVSSYGDLAGYRMRTHIAKSLQTRSKAIRNAVKQYNEHAVPLNRPTLDWTKVSHYSFLDEFNLLRDTRSNVREKPWADPVIRETMRKYQRLQRVKEEIVRCNIEIRRLHTSIVDEVCFFDTVTRSLSDDHNADPLNIEIEDFIRLRMAMNSMLLARIAQTQSLPGFTGDLTPGVRKGSVNPGATTSTTSLSAQSADTGMDSQSDSRSAELSDDEDNELDDASMGDLGGLVDFVSNIS
ncbi:hypothetical protein Hypma_006601 [Hypsizygus marmoreus]|uniref:Uncharacterized protein n=1 Tax=Hypsizygus marmoreus TaxID=39966 RepID=A0A369JU00_HYPMA|nr:hypothetical protein Hypma_006601 [Hypsizygus marmoreus]